MCFKLTFCEDRGGQENWRATLAAEDSRQQQLLHQQQQQQQQVQLHQQQQQQQALQKAEAEHQAEVRRLKKRLSKERAHAASQLEVRAQKTLQVPPLPCPCKRVQPHTQTPRT